MKKLIIIISALVLLAGCVTTDQRVIDLEAKVSKLEKKIVMGMATGAGASFFPARSIDGNSAGDLDYITGMVIGDVAMVVTNEDAAYGNAVFIYTYTDFGSEVTESLPYRVKPDTGSSANYAWELAFSSVAVPVVISSTPWTLTIGEARAGFAQITVTGEVDLPAAATVGFGTMWCIAARDAEVITLDPNGTEKMNINGAASGAGTAVTSDGAAGDYSCFIAVTDTDTSGTDGWWQVGYGKTAWQ